MENVDDDNDDIELLEKMILNAEAKTESEKPKNNFFIDSSDDEEDKYSFSTRYNEFGRDINKKLKEDVETKRFDSIKIADPAQPGTSRSSSFSTSVSQPTTSMSKAPISDPVKNTVFCDPVFGLRIVNPVISSITLKERMIDKCAVGVQRVRFHTERGDVSRDWVIAGVLVSKAPIKQTQKGDQFSIWTISDLKGEIKVCTVFLFRSAHRELWKTSVGTVIAILNPKALERKDDKVEAVLSVDNHQKVMILGQSNDLGKCGAKKNNGELCGAIVNKTDCNVCIFHMKKEYSKFKRSDLQTGGLGRGVNELRNKILGKSEVFYAGQSYTAVKAAKPVKQMAKDRERLMSLSEYYSMPYDASSPRVTTSSVSGNDSAPTSTSFPKRAASLDSNHLQRKRDLERLKLLQGTEKPQIVLTHKFQQDKQELKNQNGTNAAPKKDANFIPKLTSENLTFTLNIPGKKNELAKQRAAAILKKKPLEVANPNLIKYRGTESGRKRIADELNTSIENDSKKAKTSPAEDEARKKKDFILKMMNAKSSHDDLGEMMEREKQEKCFERLEKKEAMEERMANTLEMKCKAVICRKCKYIYFSASDLCKQEKHELKVVDATKRFYQCGDCKSRTITLFRIPRDACKNCRSCNWKRTGMMKERVAYVGEELSIRGDEEMFIGSAVKGSLNLLVPE